MSPIKNRISRSSAPGTSFKRRNSVQVGKGWLQEYSTFNMHQIQEKIVLSRNCESFISSSEKTEQKMSLILKMEKAHSLNTMKTFQSKMAPAFEFAMDHDFDIFKFSDNLTRKHALPYLMMHLLDNLPNKEENVGQFNEHKLVLFLNQIAQGYKQKVQYHNDLHGADVAQMMFLLIKDANLVEIAELKHFDMVAMLISSVCHDFDHDGFNNAYHVNKMSNRALRYHDESV